MAPLPVINDVFRCVFEYSSALGVTPVNVIHVHSSSGTPADVGEAIEAGATDDMILALGANWEWQGVGVTPLDGATATHHHTFASAITGPQSGQSVLNLSACINFGTTRRGSRGRGRVFIGPTTEDLNTGGNVWASLSQSDMESAWLAFQLSLNTNSPSCQLVVASYVHADYNEVTSVRADTLLRSTKSRLNQVTR